MNKVDCDKYDECLKNKSFDPFCYRIGPPEDEQTISQGGFLYRRSGLCWFALTGKIWWRELGRLDDKA